VENFAQGLCGEESLLDSIACISSGQSLFVFLDELESHQFSKNTLLNLVNTAVGKTQLVFIVARSLTQNYHAYKRTFGVIEAQRMTKSEMAPLVAADQLPLALENYGFYKMSI